jgi:DNA-directed RNA polymerase subunit RPC12/RpoP
MMAARCPRCGSEEVQPRVRRTLLKWLAGFVFLHAYRCRQCERRFLAWRLPF